MAFLTKIVYYFSFSLIYLSSLSLVIISSLGLFIDLPLVGYQLHRFTLVLFCSSFLLNQFLSTLTEKSNKLTLRLLNLALTLSLPGIIHTFQPNFLQKESHRIVVRYQMYACDCAQWKVISIDGRKQKSGEDIYLDTEDETYSLEDQLPNLSIKTKLELVGKFHFLKGFSKSTLNSYENPERARIFCYTRYREIH